MNVKFRRKRIWTVLLAAAVGVLLVACLVLVLAQRRDVAPVHTRPRRVLSAGTNVIKLNPGGNLQAALAEAELGDTIVLTAGAVYKGPITLPNKSGGTGTDADYITIRSSDPTLPGEGVRVSPSDAPKMAAIVAPANATHAIDTKPGAHHYKFVNVEIRPATPTLVGYDLIWLGDVGAQQTTLAQVPHDLSFDRCYIHAFAAQTWKRGIALNSAQTTITNSYLADFHVVGQECQAILGWNGPGPFHLINNYLEAAGENVMFGGADPSIPNLRPSDIDIRRNTFSKPMSWNPAHPSYAGMHWMVKNVLELKNARRVVIDGNLFENNWADAQDGTAIMLTPRNQQGICPWCGIEDISFTNNIIRHVAAGINILGTDNLQP